MSDRIVILKDGKIQQDGKPGELYNRPANAFVADFLGKSNFIDVTVTGTEGDLLHCEAKGTSFPAIATENGPRSGQARVALRPERLRLAAPGEEFLPARVRQVSYLGERCQVIVTHDTLGDLLVSCPTWKSGLTPAPDLPVSIGWDRDACVLLSPE